MRPPLWSGTFNSGMALAVRHGGLVARHLQGRVENDGKVAESLPNDVPGLLARRGTKTVVDDVVQEILLVTAAELLTPASIQLDAEEETESVARFQGGASDPCLIVDPV